MIEQKLVQKQMQKMLFTPRMQESVHILQMPIIELKNLLENELESNPLLEEVSASEMSLDITPEAEENEYGNDLKLTKAPTLHEVLLRQLSIHATCNEEVEIGEEIIGNIDDDGYLKASFEEIAQSLSKDVAKIERVARMTQSFEPPGVCARDLKESLLIQLEAKGKKDGLAWRLVENHLEGCGKKQYAQLAKAMAVPVEEIKSAVAEEISKLEPRPGRAYSKEGEAQCIVPDIYIKKVDDEYLILDNKQDVPNVRINSLYKDILADDNSDSQTRDYVKDKLRAASFLLKCIEQRRQTMHKIMEFLINEQGECMEKGRSFMKPLTFKDVARAIGRHESTVSRAIANKYIDTPSGIYELREFFNGNSKICNGNSGLGETAENNNNHSSVSVKFELKSLIDSEDKQKPLSDQKLQKIFLEKGINISRRTITKYRKELKILPSHLRKI